MRRPCGAPGVFYEGLAVVEKNGEWFHILESGEPAYPQRYELVEYFQQGRAWVRKSGGKWVTINQHGKEV